MSLNRTRLEEKFRAEYQKLNEQQKKAVDHIEGPVMVIAGPGTGKTQILASRIGKILLDTDSQPQNILCLTYTDAGVVAMRKRLLQFIGPEAYKVNIYTFHAFCNDIIQDNLSVFEKTALDPISELEKIALLKELIDGFSKDHPLKRFRGDVYYEVKTLAKLFSNMKREGWSPTFLLERIDLYLKEIEEDTSNQFHYQNNRKDKWKKGDPKPSLAEEQEKMKKLKAAIGEFDHYQQLMRRNNRYDFDDMINWVIAAFEENKNLLANYQEQYLYILVDEYQDTSGTQNRIVELLMSYWDKPNVFVVGDDDQSIYRFQGANIENMKKFRHAFGEDLLTVVLTNNYRSTQPILDIAKSLIDRNSERLVKDSSMKGLDKDLLASNIAISHLLHQPRILEYESADQEMIGITIEVQRLLAEGIAPGRIAVIYRENKYGEELASYFGLRKIPFYTRRSQNILQLPLAQKLILLLKYLAAELDTPYGGDEMLFEILHFNWFKIAPMEIARLCIEVAEKKYGAKKTALRERIFEKINEPAPDLFTNNLSNELRKTGTLLENLIAEVPNLTLQGLIEKIIREAGLLSEVMRSDDKFDQLQILNGFFDFVKEETRRNPGMKLADLVATLSLMEKENIRLPLVQVSGSDKGINLLTAHGSKGLEFQYVFFAGCNASAWEKKRTPSDGFSLPETVFDARATTAAAPSSARDEEELRRLFYVALTRAEQHIYISYSRYRADGRELEPSMFLAEIKDQHEIPVEKIIIAEEALADFALLRFTGSQMPEIEKMEEDFIARILEKFVLSVTALNNFLKCPLQFYYLNLVRIPSPKNEATEFGSAVHYALEQLFRKMKDHPQEQFPAKEVFLADFEWYMNRHRESFTKEQFERRLQYGNDILNNYYDQHIDRFSRIVAIELNIKNVIYQSVPIKGKLDKLEFDGKAVNVVDYKTGDPDKAREKLKAPDAKNPLGGDYWRQAVFYKILVDHYGNKGWMVQSAEFDFIEPNKKKEYAKARLQILPEDMEIVGAQIKDSWEKIQQRAFYTGCGKEDCHWCQFVKTNNLAVALHETEEGDGDDD